VQAQLAPLHRTCKNTKLDNATRDLLAVLPNDPQELQDYIVREGELAQSKKGRNADHFDRILEEYEQRSQEIVKLQVGLEESKNSMEDTSATFQALMNKWKPQVERMVEEICRRFTELFFQLNGCFGEVALEWPQDTPEDVSKWQISIKVQFRLNEAAHQLSAFRQSGGEKSVSTMLYLLAMQGLSHAPFRVVDEINQGMDARNERMVHDLIVRTTANTQSQHINSQHNHSQHFLITPKLLRNLSYAPHMKILCVYSGKGLLPNK
jgi:chromosome segregation ATPase